MKKKLIVLFFLLCASLLAVLIFSACGGDGDSENGGGASGLTYRLDGDYYTVTGLSEDADVTEIVIPAVYNGKPVREIDYNAFSGERKIISVIISDSVTSIGEQAFYECDSLASVTIRNSVTSIGSGAFYGCYRLVEVFNKSSLNIQCGSSDNGYVAYYAKHVYAEEGGSRLTHTEDGYIFYYDGENAYLVGYGGTESSLTLPSSFTAYDGTKINKYEIKDHAFYEKGKLVSVVIPDSVTSIGTLAFYYCYSLKSIVIPDRVTSIGRSAFSGCSSLKTVYYKGTQDQWEDISIGDYNNDLTESPRYYYSASQPMGDGNYWHYAEDGKTPVIW